MIVINQEEVSSIAKKWECCLSGYILGLLPHFPSLTEFLTGRWELVGTLDLIGRGKSSFILRFSDKDERDRVLKLNNHSVSGHTLLLKVWSPSDPADNIALSEIPVWIQIRDFPVQLWDDDIFSKIASTLGRPIAVDRRTKEGIRLDFIRLCVAMRMSSVFPESLKLKVANRDIISVAIDDEWKPKLCSYCNIFGHVEGICHLALAEAPRGKGGAMNVTKRWLPVNRNIQVREILASENVSESTAEDNVLNVSTPVDAVTDVLIPEDPQISPCTVLESNLFSPDSSILEVDRLMLQEEHEDDSEFYDAQYDPMEHHTLNSRSKGKNKARADRSVHTPVPRKKGSKLGGPNIPRMMSVAGSSPASQK